MKRILCLLVLFPVLLQAQFNIPEKPVVKEQRAVYDYYKILNKQEFTALDRKLINYADTTSTQIVIAIVESTNGEDISLLGARWGEKWQVGQKDKDNGIFILMAYGDRKIDINTGRGIEYRMTDLESERIINRIIVPNFKRGNYYQGLDQATDAIFKYLNGEFVEDRDLNKAPFPWSFFIVLAFILFIIILSSRKGNNGNNRGGGTSL
ncbi:TPM domain-containing protein, partial [Nonlabens tegetincola]|uniref:TPM domain-containing protein n=1 Tax=Nonlabens tegetincola TaxID=323273 RepID=UPI0030C84D7A